MNEIKSFSLKEDSNLYGYKIIECLGRGWTSEVYKVEECISGAIRCIKIFANYEDHQRISDLKRATNYAEKLSAASEYRITPRYYHSFIANLDDPIGNICIVMDFIDGDMVTKTNVSGENKEDFKKELKKMHKHSKNGVKLTICDWDKSNFLVEKETKKIWCIDPCFGTSCDGPCNSKEKDLEEAEKMFKSLKK